jgi:hypothetical protein
MCGRRQPLQFVVSKGVRPRAIRQLCDLIACVVPVLKTRQGRASLGVTERGQPIQIIRSGCRADAIVSLVAQVKTLLERGLLRWKPQ